MLLQMIKDLHFTFLSMRTAPDMAFSAVPWCLDLQVLFTYFMNNSEMIPVPLLLVVSLLFLQSRIIIIIITGVSTSVCAWNCLQIS